MYDPVAIGLAVFGKTGDEVLVTCPYHDDHKPSASFNLNTGLFHCFACGEGRTAKQLAEDLGGEIDETFGSKSLPFREDFKEPEFDWRVRVVLARHAFDNDYLKSRGVSNRVVDILDVKEFDDGVAFPLPEKSGEIIGLQVRRYTKTPKYMFYGDKPALFPLTMFNSARRAVLVEGIFGMIRGRDAGFNTYAVMGAASLRKAITYFFDRSNVVGVFDPDKAGYLASAKLASIGIACLTKDFEADEMTIEQWRAIIGNKNNFSMNVGYFAQKVIKLGGDTKSTIKQILKFEKDNTL